MHAIVPRDERRQKGQGYQRGQRCISSTRTYNIGTQCLCFLCHLCNIFSSSCYTSSVPKVTFLFGDGQVKTVETEGGKTLLQIALDQNIPMEHACGGNGFCTTCLCDVQQGMTSLSPRNDREENMGVTEDPHRLGCQAEVNGDVTVKLMME